MNKAVLELPVPAIREYCRRYGIRRLALFGSALRDDFGPESDLDVLVEFQPNTVVGFITFAHMQNELTDLFGREVDLNTPNSLSKYYREQVLQEAETVYVEA